MNVLNCRSAAGTIVTSMDDNVTGSRLLEAREAAGWSQGQLALRSGVSRSLISKIEAGERKPKQETLEALAAALYRSAEWLRGDEVQASNERSAPNAARQRIEVNLLSIEDLNPEELEQVADVVEGMRLRLELSMKEDRESALRRRKRPTKEIDKADNEV